MFLNRCFLVSCVNNIFSPGPMQIQHVDSYKAKFMAAIRLWKKREEEKRVWECFDLFILILIMYCNLMKT